MTSKRAMAGFVCLVGLAGCENLSELGSELRQSYNEALVSLDNSLIDNGSSPSQVGDNEAKAIVTLDRPAVRRLQSRLTKLGFRPGPADGILGARTVKAINGYQTKYDLTVTNSISSKFLEHLETMSAKSFAEEHSPPQQQQPDLSKSPVNLASDDFPTYLPGTTFIYSNGETERVLGANNLVVRWARSDGSTFSAHRNFLLPKAYWTSGNERGTAIILGAPDGLWPLREGEKVSFKAKITMQRENDPQSIKRRVDLWHCQNDGSRNVTVEAGTFETLVLVCSRGADPASPEFVRTWYYAKAVRHYVRIVESYPKRNLTKSADLVAIRPGALGWPPIVRAALARALVHALEKAGDSSQMPWTSSGVSTNVTIEAKSRFVAEDGRPCRRFVQIWSENGHPRHYPAVACKAATGKWTIPGLKGRSANSLATSDELS